MRLGATSNVSFYTDGYKRGKQDVILDIVWNPKIEKAFFDGFQSAKGFPGVEKSQSQEE
jgi:hypothetical protein